MSYALDDDAHEPCLGNNSVWVFEKLGREANLYTVLLQVFEVLKLILVRIIP